MASGTTRLVLWLLVAGAPLAAGCVSPEAAGPAELRAAGTQATLLAAHDLGMRVIDRRGSRELLAGPASDTLPQTDERPTFAMLVRDGTHATPSPGRVLGGALVDGGAVWVSPAHELIDAQGRVLDRDVVPELAVSADARTIAYPHRGGAGPGVYVLELPDGAPVRASTGLANADRPMFLPDGRLLVIGSRASGVAGIWIVEPNGEAQPIPVTNASLRTGLPLGPTFVPPPAEHASMHLDGADLVYDDGRGERRVALGLAR